MTAFSSQNLLEEVKEWFAALAHSMVGNKALKHQDANIRLEYFFRDLLNLVYGWKLENANAELAGDQDSFDLVDRDLGIVVQVTVSRNAKKIRKTITGFITSYRNDYSRLKFCYPEMSCPKSSLELSELLNGFDFDINRDRIDFNKILCSVANLQIHEQRRVVELVSEQLEPLSRGSIDSYRRTSQTAGIAAYDTSEKPSHSSLFLSDNTEIKKVFVNPKFECIIRKQTGDIERYSGGNFEALGIRILDEHRLLFVVGPYGSGKTICCKRLGQCIRDTGGRVIYVHAYDLKEIIASSGLKAAIAEGNPQNKTLTLIIDAFDEIDFKDPSQGDVGSRFLAQIGDALSNRSLRVIINTRYFRMNEDDVIESFSYQFLSLQHIEQVAIFWLNVFGGDEMDKWIKQYTCERSKYSKREIVFGRTNIRDVDKHLVNNCSNPLFLYLITSSFCEEGGASINSIWQVYNSFVERTCKGKFDGEQSYGSHLFRGYAQDYRSFLKWVAMKTAGAHDLDFESTVEGPVPLDPNQKYYKLSDIDVVSQSSDWVGKLRSLESFDVRDSRFRRSLFSCYFFSQDQNDDWYFRDNNILLFLAADHLLNSFHELAKEINTSDRYETTQKAYEAFKQDCNVSLHPLVFTFLISAFNELESNTKDEISNALYTLIQDGFAVGFTKNTAEPLSPNKINADLLIALGYLNIRPARFINISYFFKRLSWLVSAARQIDGNYRYFVQRFMRGVNFSAVELRRINLDDYDLSGSRFSDVGFIQCKLRKTILSGSTFRDVRFALCDLDRTFMVDLAGNLEFESCDIADLRVVLSSRTSGGAVTTGVVFKRCFLKGVTVGSVNAKGTAKFTITFQNCDLQAVRFDELKCYNMLFINCVVSGLVIAGGSYVRGQYQKCIFGERFYSNEGAANVVLTELD